jgi:hypothetical protein
MKPSPGGSSIFDLPQCVHHRLGAGGSLRNAMNPDGLVICSCIEHLFLSRTGDRRKREGANALCQAFDPTADGRQSGFVTDEEPPIEIVRNHERASGAADRYGVSDLSLLRPADRRTGRMQRDIDSQLFGFGVEVSRGEVASFEIAPFARNIQLDMIVGGWSNKVFEVLATEYYSQHPRRDMPLFQDGKRSAARIVFDATGSVFHIFLSVGSIDDQGGVLHGQAASGDETNAVSPPLGPVLSYIFAWAGR